MCFFFPLPLYVLAYSNPCVYVYMEANIQNNVKKKKVQITSFFGQRYVNFRLCQFFYCKSAQSVRSEGKKKVRNLLQKWLQESCFSLVECNTDAQHFSAVGLNLPSACWSFIHNIDPQKYNGLSGCLFWRWILQAPLDPGLLLRKMICRDG